MNSSSHDQLKDEERGKPAWIFKTTKNPPSITIGRGGEYIHVVSGKELKDVMRGFFPEEYFMDVLYDEEGKRPIHVLHMIDLSRYSWLPKYMYRRFLRAACDVLGIEYKVEMLEAVTATRLTPKAFIIFPEKSVFEKAEKRTAEIKEVEEYINREIERMKELMKSIKEEKK